MRALRDVYDILERQVDQMVRLVGDLLDMSRIAEGKIAVKKEPVVLCEIVRTALETCRSRIDRK